MKAFYHQILGKQLREENKEQNKSDGGAHWCTQKLANCFDQVFLSSSFLPQSITLMRNQPDCDVIIVMLQ